MLHNRLQWGNNDRIMDKTREQSNLVALSLTMKWFTCLTGLSSYRVTGITGYRDYSMNLELNCGTLDGLLALTLQETT